jgi:membrane fusion protein (multidrug efflux system)
MKTHRGTGDHMESGHQNQAGAAAPRSGGRRLIAIPIIVVVALGVFAYRLTTRGWEATEDAQVEGDLVPISARVSGYVDQIHVKENQQVSPGQVLVQLDSRDLRARLRSSEATLALQQAQRAAASTQVSLVARTSAAGEAQAGASVVAANAGVAASLSQIASAEAQAVSVEANAQAAREAISSARSDIATAEAQVEAARAGLQAAEANVSSAEAQARRIGADFMRMRQLYSQGAVSKQQLDAAQAADTSAQAALEAARQGVRSAEAALRQARARKAAADAGLKQAASRAASAQAAAQQARAAAKTARTVLGEAEARLSGARAAESGARTVPQQISISKAQNQAAGARIRQAEADIRTAQLLLSYTRIAAPVAGVVSQKSVQPGQYLQPGQLLMALVPLRNVWVVANFKETQIGAIRVGQPAEIEVDTYPGRTFRAHVDSLGAATGVKFSLLPPQNATGNFVKVVQRVPVKIVFEGPLPEGVVLRPGLNVVARVRVAGRG